MKRASGPRIGFTPQLVPVTPRPSLARGPTPVPSPGDTRPAGVVWHALTTLALALSAALTLRVPFWNAQPGDLLVLGSFACAYPLALLMYRALRTAHISRLKAT